MQNKYIEFFIDIIKFVKKKVYSNKFIKHFKKTHCHWIFKVLCFRLVYLNLLTQVSCHCGAMSSLSLMCGSIVSKL